MKEREERLKALIAEMVSLVPTQREPGAVLMVVAKTLQCDISSVYQVWRYNTWPYQRIDVDGLTIGVLEPSEENRDILGISWPDQSAPSGAESRSRFIPPRELDRVQHETYQQLRQDGCPVDRAAELAENLHTTR